MFSRTTADRAAAHRCSECPDDGRIAPLRCAEPVRPGCRSIRLSHAGTAT